MNRRTFAKIIGAAAASCYAGAPAIKPAAGPVRLEYDGYVFVEDPNPIRFILTPVEMPGGIIVLSPPPVEWRREIAGRWVENPEWVAAGPEADIDFAFHHATFRALPPVKPPIIETFD